MPFRVNHIHLKSNDPETTANWFVKAFNVKIISDNVRPVGDRFIITEAEGVGGQPGMRINISSERTGETLGPADADAHYGLEHFGFDTDDMQADLKRLEDLGAEIKEVQDPQPNGQQIAFIAAPGGIRIELIKQPTS